MRHRQCLQAQSEHFSPRAVAQVDQAICHTLEHLGELCDNCDCDRIVSCLLRKLDQWWFFGSDQADRFVT